MAVLMYGDSGLSYIGLYQWDELFRVIWQVVLVLQPRPVNHDRWTATYMFPWRQFNYDMTLSQWIAPFDISGYDNTTACEKYKHGGPFSFHIKDNMQNVFLHCKQT